MLGSCLAKQRRRAHWYHEYVVREQTMDRRLLDLFRIECPILLAPMAGAMDTELAIAVAQGG